MARTTFRDFYTDFQFHLFDLTTPIQALGGGGFPSPVIALSPQVGFKSIDPPSVSVDQEEVEPGNQPLAHHVPTGGSIETITLKRGVFVGDHEFWSWIKRTLYGRGAFRRVLGLVQLHGLPSTAGAIEGSTGSQSFRRFAVAVAKGAAALAAASGSKIGATVEGAGAFAGGAAAAASAANQFGAGSGAAEVAEQVQNLSARAWLLQDCVPVDYQPGTLDADNEEVTVAELELQPEAINEENFPPSLLESAGSFGRAIF